MDSVVTLIPTKYSKRSLVVQGAELECMVVHFTSEEVDKCQAEEDHFSNLAKKTNNLATAYVLLLKHCALINEVPSKAHTNTVTKTL